LASEPEVRIVYDPTEDRQPRKAKNFEEVQAKIKVEQPDKPIEKPAVVEEKPAKKAYRRQPKETKYPVALFVNAYGFIHIPNDMRQDLGWGQKGDITDLTAEKNHPG